ncbi:toxin-antitoxin system YwqK family antitoxin [Rufibacter psychrotolerans]|uniref:toxin-antitoxin system YwqK family antitoxin n=1 Tax=Rufibacter psychrotolerans TaxID=2812556 RepID=UPI00196730DB|nr:hypothetical protein [Rufibacter sp. SYSU D00308]
MQHVTHSPGFRRKATAVALLVFFSCLMSQPGWAWPWQWNRYDKKELRNGRWRVFHDADQKVVHYQGRYRHGKEVGVWKTYTADGNLYFREKIKRRKQHIKTVYYHPNGKVSHRGMAYLVPAASGGVQYYWHGDWEYFDQQGQALGVKTFVKGEPTTNSPSLSSTKKEE